MSVNDPYKVLEISPEATDEAVSYTHLTMIPPASCFALKTGPTRPIPKTFTPAKGRRPGGRGSSATKGRWNLTGIPTVSYTHLDVYKRQVVASLSARVKPPPKMPIALAPIKEWGLIPC